MLDDVQPWLIWYAGVTHRVPTMPMTIQPLRPTFDHRLGLSPAATIARLMVLLDDRDLPIDGRAAGNHLMLVIPPERRHFWSPWLHIEVHDDPEGSLISARFSPNPSVWTAFMLTYIALGTLAFFASMFGIAQWLMHAYPTALLALPILTLVAVIMYWASMVGQRLAQEQMRELYNAVHRSLDTPGTQATAIETVIPVSASHL